MSGILEGNQLLMVPLSCWGWERKYQGTMLSREAMEAADIIHLEAMKAWLANINGGLISPGAGWA